MKKGFTLIELLAVLMLLVVVSIIAIPIVLDLVKGVIDSSSKSQAEYILDAAKNYYAESMFDDNKKVKITGEDNVYYELSLKEKRPEKGAVYINKAGLVAMAVEINEVCYKKNFDEKIEIVDLKHCDISLVKDDVGPIVELSLIDANFNEYGWLSKDLFINVSISDEKSGPYGYRWCIDSKECEPQEFKEIESNYFSSVIESNNIYGCVIGLDFAGNESERVCVGPYKVDKTNPILVSTSEQININEGDSNLSSTYFNVTYGISGGALSCNKENTNILNPGTQTLTCTATGNNGLTATANKNIIVVGVLANSPQLFSNMIPVIWNGSNWVYADINQQWYNYYEKQWANAVVLNVGVTKNIGDLISESEIGLMYVWIPRYKYVIFNGNNESVPVQEIRVVFEEGITKTGTVNCQTQTSGSGNSSEVCTDSTNGSVINGVSTYTHPAFTFGTKELTGIWIGKFENSAPNVTSNSVQKIIIKPNVKSWRGGSMSRIFTSAENIKTDYGVLADHHIIKNMEWGAVAYLAQSKYGRCTSGTCVEVSRNNSTSYYTGRSDGTNGSGTSTSSNGTYEYHTQQGGLASTTGNIYGIYDMSGGAWEYVMGNMVNASNQFYISSSGFSTDLPSKYYDSYTYGTSNTTHGRGRLGDGTKEAMQNFGSESGGWYGDYGDFLSSSSSWAVRGGRYGNNTLAGIFAVGDDPGGGGVLGNYASRVAMTEYEIK